MNYLEALKKGLANDEDLKIGSIPAVSEPYVEKEDPRSSYQSGIDNQTVDVGPTIGLNSRNFKNDNIDASYRLYTGQEAKEFFVKGRVFAMVWHENGGRSANPNVTETSAPLDIPFNRHTVNADGVTIFSHIRRFVIVKANPSRKSCLAIPVSSYRDGGLADKRMSMREKQAHAILHDQRRQPRLLAGEYHMDKYPIAVEMAIGEELSPSSRLNFSSIQTIDWNVRVKNVGRVSASTSLRRLELYSKQELLGGDEEGPLKNSKQSISRVSGVSSITKVSPQDNWSTSYLSVSERPSNLYSPDRVDKQTRLAKSTRPPNFKDDSFGISHLFTSEGKPIYPKPIPLPNPEDDSEDDSEDDFFGFLYSSEGKPIDPTGSIPYTSTNTYTDTNVGWDPTIHDVKSPLSKSTKKGFGNHENHDYVMFQGQHKHIEEHKVVGGKEEALDVVQDLHKNFVPTDSGYASLPHSKRVLGSDKRLGGTEIGHDEFSDTATLYSQASTVPTVESKSLIDEFAETLCNDLGAGQLEAEASDTLLGDLSEIFADFALRLGQEVLSIEARQAMSFIYKRRSEFETAFRSAWATALHESNSPVMSHESSECLPLSDLMSMWHSRENDEPPEPPENDDIAHEEIAVSETHCNTASDFRRTLIFESTSYHWLRTMLQKRLRLTVQQNDVTSTVLRTIPKPRNLGKFATLPMHSVLVRVMWSPRTFLVQETGNSAFDYAMLESLMTLTGSTHEVQALTCLDYMKQTWPISGPSLLNLIVDTLSSNDSTAQLVRPDGTSVLITESDTSFSVTIKGTRHSVAEVAEQLAWLGAALRSPIEKGKPNYCKPRIHLLRGANSRDPPSYEFEINFDFENEAVDSSTGSCWFPLFRTPVIAKDFSIRSRPALNLGLEIPLNVSAQLVGTRLLSQFRGNIFLKGFHLMLALTGSIKDVWLWHLYHDKGRNHLSYLEHDLQALDDIRLTDAGTRRHFVGWCHRAESYVGTANSSRSIGRSRLPRTHPSCVLDTSYLSPARSIFGGAPYTLMQRDQVVHSGRKTWARKLDHFGQKFILLWDTSCNRGWLVSAVSALLHVVRKSLDLDHTDSSETCFLMDLPGFCEATDSYNAKAARHVLLKNLKLQLSSVKSTLGGLETAEGSEQEELLEHRMEEIYDSLEKLITDQEDVEEKARRGKIHRPRRFLEGWDFVDLASHRDPTYPKVSTLQPPASNYVDFLRSISAVTLFGTNMGELLMPSDPSLCLHWKTLPKDKFYVGVSADDIEQIMELHGDPDSEPKMLSDSLMLLRPPKPALDTCSCDINSSNEAGMVHTVWPKHFSRLLTNRKVPDDQEIGPSGAFILGHNPSIDWYWPDIGDVTQGNIPQSHEKTDTSFEDSGLGSSLHATTTSSTELISISQQLGVTSQEVRSYGNTTVNKSGAVLGDINYNYITNNTFASVDEMYREQAARRAALSQFQGSVAFPLRLKPEKASQDTQKPLARTKEINSNNAIHTVGESFPQSLHEIRQPGPSEKGRTTEELRQDTPVAVTQKPDRTPKNRRRKRRGGNPTEKPI